MKKRSVIENLLVTDFANEGKSLARLNGKVVFVEGAVPGDTVDIKVLKSKKDWMETVMVKLVKPSELRREPFCKHFGVCGGCKWQHLDYQSQLKFKQQSVVDSLERIGHVKTGEVLPIIGGEKQTHYRNKLDYSASDRAWLTLEELNAPDMKYRPALGFHVPGSFTTVLDIEKCHLQPEPTNAIRLAVKKFMLEHNLTFYNNYSKFGFLRTLIIRNTKAGEVMVIVVIGENDNEHIEKLMEILKEQFPQITSLNYVVSKKVNDTIFDQQVITYSGLPYITEWLEDLQFRISPKSFFQTNTEQALNLYRVAKDFAQLTGNETVYDLYTGTGSIALFIARYCKHIIGIEQVSDAIADAKLNAELNHITNVSFYTADIRHSLSENFIAQNGRPEVIITDPPRAGMHPDVVKNLLQIEPQRIVYVSCNPASQARDLMKLSQKYSVAKIQPVDMFPHTAHIENVALLEKEG